MFKFIDNFYDWWKNIDKIILFLIIILFSLGLFFSLVSTSLIASDKLDTNSYFFFLKHLIFITLGSLTLFLFSILKEEFLLQLSLILFCFIFIALLMVPFIGVEVKGSKRWIDLGFLPRFQPIELLKPYFVIIISSLLCINKNIYYKYLLSGLVLLPVVLLLLSQPDLGQTLLIIMVWLTLIFISGINIFLFFLFFTLSISLCTYLIFFVSKFEYMCG